MSFFYHRGHRVIIKDICNKMAFENFRLKIIFAE